MAPRVMAADATSTSTGGLEEIVVTAQRRTENIQNVPITIQALGGDQLRQLNVTTTTDLLKYTPNVTFSGNGPPGTGNIFMRGLSAGGSGNQSQSTTAPFPNVALYLDDQSMQFPARNNDVYMVDMERVEILEGPQGTLFGGGSQAGAVRYITNKPKLNVTGGNFNAGYGATASGDPNTNLNVTFNLPLITDKLAIRGTIFSDHRGGYISNVRGAISVPPVTNVKSTTYPGPFVRPGSAEASNAGVIGNNLNTADYIGSRLSALYEFNDDWNVLIQQNNQSMQAHGYWTAEPNDPNGRPLEPYKIMAFTPGFDKDRYNSTAWTLNGAVGDLKLVYAGSFMTRHIDSQQDYSNYLRSPHGSWYACSGAGAGYYYFRFKKNNSAADKGASTAKPTTCFSPVGSWRDQVRSTHESHEIRLQTPEDKRLRGLVGAFYEDFAIYDRMDFNYMGMPQCTPGNLAIALAPWNLNPQAVNPLTGAPIPITPPGPDCAAAPGPIAGYFANDPSLRDYANTAFGEDIHRGYKQTAFFTSWDFDLIPKVLTLTAGTRHYQYHEFEEGSEYYSASSSVLNVPNGSVRRGFGINLKNNESGFKSRANLTWHITPDVMLYYTWSQGFRPGGFNRTHTSIDGSKVFLAAVAHFLPNPGAGATPAQVAAYKASLQYYKAAGYESDTLTNNEIGLKTEFLNHRLQINASAYVMDWKNSQIPLFDPTLFGNTTFNVNGPDFRIRGLELQVNARVSEGLTVQGSGSWNSTEQLNNPCLKISVPGGPNPVGGCITQVEGQPYANPFGAVGKAPAFSPAFALNMRVRYDWFLGEYRAFWNVGANRIASQRTQPDNFRDGDAPNVLINTTLLKYRIPANTTYDAAFGLSKDSWSAQLTCSNCDNSDAITNANSAQYVKNVVPLRPRVLTLQVGYKF